MLVSLVRGTVWNDSTLVWESQKQAILNAGSVTIPGTVAVTGTFWPATQPVSQSGTSPTIASGQVNGLGNNTLITPTSGKKLRLFYLSYNPLLAVEAAFRFGATGTLFLRNNITANSVVAKEFGVSRYLEGAIDEALILNLSLAVSCNWNCFYVEV